MFRNAGRVATIVVSAALTPLLIAPTAANAASDSPSCSAPSEMTRLDHAINRTAARISAGRSIRIVALGSSSTAGAGATSPANCYPARLETELRQRLPNADIVVLNRGIGGEVVREMLARLESSVLAEQPDLVLWQVGTNAIVDEEKPSEEGLLVRKGLARLRAEGVDVVLIDPQYVPKVIAKPGATTMVRVLHNAARDEKIGVFRRFAIMGHWRQAMRIPFGQFTSRDGLHMNDWSYGCIAELLASSLVDAASTAVPTASKPTSDRTPS